MELGEKIEGYKIEHMKAAKIKTIGHPKGEIEIFEIRNASGATVTLSNVGAGILSVNVPDREGRLANVSLCYGDPADYLGDGPCMGKTPGRIAGRITNSTFTLDGKQYHVDPNIAPHHLHGGAEGFANKLWKGVAECGKVMFMLISPDGDQGYPGTLDAEVTYSWSDDNELRIDYRAQTDKPTVVNLTNHAYFNLSGENSGPMLGHTLRLYASKWLPANDKLIVTGELAAVEGTPMDFRTAKKIGRDMKEDFAPLNYGKGYDNCWVADAWKDDGALNLVAELYDETTGRKLEVSSTHPGIQVYGGNWLGGSPLNPEGRSYNDYDGIAIECQRFPDSPNNPHFPSVVLRPGEEYRQTIAFRFSA